VGRIHDVKRDLLALRRALWPLREAMSALLRDTAPRISPETRIFLRDTYDHLIQIVDLVETYREIGSDLTDVYLSSASNRLNEVMKVLTIMSTIFIPLNFIAGVYGMNFDTAASPFNMPELGWYLGYPMALLLMLLVTLTLLLFFRHRGWIGQRGAAAPVGQRGAAAPVGQGRAGADRDPPRHEP
jgi:magnesium transporter